MTFPSQQHPRKAWLVVAALVLACGYLAWTMVSTLASLPSESETGGEPEDFDRLRITDFQHTVYAGERPALSLHADVIIHRRRSLGPVAINPIKELVFRGVNIEMTAPEMDPRASASAGAYLAVLIQQMLSQADLGIVSRVLMEDLELTLLNDRATVFSLSTRKAEIAMAEPVVELSQGFRLISANGDRLRAHRARWEVQRQIFDVDGPYLLTTAAGPAYGSGRIFRVDPSGAIVR